MPWCVESEACDGLRSSTARLSSSESARRRTHSAHVHMHMCVPTSDGAAGGCTSHVAQLYALVGATACSCAFAEPGPRTWPLDVAHSVLGCRMALAAIWSSATAV